MCLFKSSLHLLLQETHGGFMWPLMQKKFEAPLCNSGTQIKSKLAADIFILLFFLTILVR